MDDYFDGDFDDYIEEDCYIHQLDEIECFMESCNIADNAGMLQVFIDLFLHYHRIAQTQDIQEICYFILSRTGLIDISKPLEDDYV